MRQRTLLALLCVAMLVASCGGQQSPPRATIPRLSDVLEPPEPCSLPVGDGRGARLVSVLPDMAAAEVLQEGDVILSLSGRQVATVADLIAAVQEGVPGEQVEVELSREDEEVTVSAELSENPDAPGQPILGVSARTEYELLPFDQVESRQLPGSATNRAIEVQGGMAVVDPLQQRWQLLDVEAPVEDWVSIDGQIVSLLPGGDDRFGSLVTDGSEPVDVGATDLTAERLLTSVADLALVAATGAEGPVVVAVDPASGDVAWTWPLPALEDGSPPVAQTGFRSPDGSAAAILVAPGLDQPTATVSLLDEQGEAIAVPGNRLQGAFVSGWFDERSLLAFPAAAMGSDAELGLAVDVISGEGSQVQLGALSLGDALRVWAVGDGRHALVQVLDRVVIADLVEPVEARPLTQRCVVEVGDPGWQP